jgi:hypothetical protein
MLQHLRALPGAQTRAWLATQQQERFPDQRHRLLPREKSPVTHGIFSLSSNNVAPTFQRHPAGHQHDARCVSMGMRVYGPPVSTHWTATPADGPPAQPHEAEVRHALPFIPVPPTWFVMPLPSSLPCSYGVLVQPEAVPRQLLYAVDVGSQDTTVVTTHTSAACSRCKLKNPMQVVPSSSSQLRVCAGHHDHSGLTMRVHHRDNCGWRNLLPPVSPSPRHPASTRTVHLPETATDFKYKYTYNSI